MFSLKENTWHSDNSFSREIDFIKFYSKGRYSNFRIRTKLGDKIGVSLAENDLNPDFHTHGYYCLDGEKIQTESFVYGEGYGRYLYFNYHLSNSGDTLIRIYDKSKSIYIREKIPVTWKKYSITW